MDEGRERLSSLSLDLPADGPRLATIHDEGLLRRLRGMPEVPSLEGGGVVATRPDVYQEGGVWCFRASSIGACLRGLVAARNGLMPQPPAAFLQGALKASSEAEGVVLRDLGKRGWKVEPAESVVLELPHGRLTGTTDGFISSVELDRCVLEIKALGRSLYEKYVRGGIANMGDPFARMYGMQISAYMLATGLPCLVAVYGKESEMTLEKLYETPPFSIEELDLRMQDVHYFAERGEWPECDAKCSSSSWYWHIHDEKEVVRLSDDEIEAKVAKAARIKETIDTLQDEWKRVSDELKKELGRGQHLIGPYSATVTHRMSTRLDADKLRREYGEEFLAPYQFEVQQVALSIRDKRRKK